MLRRLAVVAVLAAAALASACAPRLARVPELGTEGRAERYRALLAERRARAVAVSANLVVWAERAGERLPGAQAELHVAAPDRVRLRVASAFGTAVDLGFTGDSMRAYVPAWRTGLRLDAAAESLGLSDPAGRVVRALTATWEPPAAAWERAAWDDSLLRVTWLEDQDSLAVEIGAAGLPAGMEIWRPGEPALKAVYRSWDRGSGRPWPAQVELVDDVHDIRVTCRASQIRFGAEPDANRLAVKWPRGAAEVTLAELRSVLGRLGVL